MKIVIIVWTGLTCNNSSGVITHLKITKRLCRNVLLLSSILIIFTSSLVMVGVLPLLHCSSSASSLWMASFIDLFFSFSFSYFFFHWSAVSSRFTVTVFRMVLALIRGTGETQAEWKGGNGDEARCGEMTKERDEERIGLSKNILASQWKWACTSLISM